MFDLNLIQDKSQEDKYKFMLISLKGQLESERDALANIANAAAIIMAFTDQLNWAGFYFLRGEGELVLGPFQGLPTYNHIQINKNILPSHLKKKYKITSRVLRVKTYDL